MRYTVGLALALTFTASASAQEMRDLVVPLKGAPSVATVGSTVYKHEKYRAMKAYALGESVQAKIIFARVDLPAGEKLLQIESKTELKACAAPTIEAFNQKLYTGCFMDDDGDGKFDRVAGNQVQGGKKLPHPVPYTESEYIDGAPGSLKQTVIFLGSTKDTLRLSYREFVNDMARPAFTEEYTFPITTNFPQPVAFKDVKMTVTAIDGAGLHYSID